MGTNTPTVKDYVYVCMTQNHWGEGKTENQALRNCRRIAADNVSDGDGNKWLAKFGYDIFYCHKDYKVNHWGEIHTAKEHPITKVHSRKPIKEWAES